MEEKGFKMRFFADLHVHSRFSRATSKELTINALGKGAVLKGLTVIGTGDFTHPSWLSEIEQDLVEAEPGLFSLKHDPGVRFILTTEISTIYKQGEQVRKVHHLLAAPDLETVHTINKALARVGNIISDGRPILGISSRDLLEIVLEANKDAFLVPAHIWTPWFSVLGSKSGFDSIGACYLDLEPHIFAVETGLSSDPPMNHRVMGLDRYVLVSNSDAHSSEKLGREAIIFDCEPDYFAMLAALKTGEGLLGTVEFFPEEGKYHLDGHRDCEVVLEPEETARLNGRCPVCGKPLTIGVLSRVYALTDRKEGKPLKAKPFYPIIPLPEILGENMQIGQSSGKVKAAYANLVRKLGGELPLLLDVDLEEIRKAGGDMLALAVSRMREGKVFKEAGYDGKFGRIRVFQDQEIDLLFDAHPGGRKRGKPPAADDRDGSNAQAGAGPREKAKASFNLAQRQAITFGEGFLVVKAGPGTGKTRVLTERMQALRERGEGAILAITFTTKACAEIRVRLMTDVLEVYTFHALAARLLRQTGIPFAIADELLVAERAATLGMGGATFIDDLLYRQSVGEGLDASQSRLIQSLRQDGFFTYEGLIIEAIRILEAPSTPTWAHILVDEFQDINPVQYRFLKVLSRNARSVMVIGDPNQAIYSFRGGNPKAFDDFLFDYPSATSIDLKETFRLPQTIAHASNAFIGSMCVETPREGIPIQLIKTSSPERFIAHEIDAQVGGLTHTTVHKAKGSYALSDIAVIVRTRHQALPVMEALARASIPFDASYARPLSEMPGVGQRLAILEKRDFLGHIKGVGVKTLERMHSDSDLGPGISEKIGAARHFLESLQGTLISQIHTIERSSLFSLPLLDEEHPFYQYARTFASDLQGFLDFCRLSNDSPHDSEKVKIITAHAAKGLEFGCVFITGQFPLPNQPLWEERNLFYVALTRAIHHLYLVCPDGPFLSNIPAALCQFHAEKFKPRSEQMILFE